MVKYCIFKVYNYKGGELSAYTNLEYDEFISDLSELFENYLEDVDILESTTSELVERLTEILTDDTGFYGNYAGSDSMFCGELYKIENNALINVDFLDYVEDIAKKIQNYARGSQ
jgi:hypothetical protein